MEIEKAIAEIEKEIEKAIEVFKHKIKAGHRVDYFGSESVYEAAIDALGRQCAQCDWREFPPCPALVTGGKCDFENSKTEISCNICNSDEIDKLLIMKRGKEEYLAFSEGSSKYPKENHAKFCIQCGRKLEGKND